jgi:translocation and assembly module TamB
LSGSYQGGTAGLKVRLVRGEWLGGALEGRADIGWDKGISLFGDLYGREIKPENLHPRWPGLINLKARGKFYRPEAGKKQIFLSVDLLESRFQGRELKGGIKGYWDQDSLKIDRAELSGRGFGFSGQGVLSQGLDFRTRVDDLAALLPGSRGALSAGGWIRWRKGRFGGRISLEGKDIFWREMGAGGLNLEAALDQEKPDTALDLEARVSRPVYRSWAADYFSGQVRGTLSAQKAALFLNGLPGKVGKVRAGLEGAYHDRQWEGRLVSFSGEVSQEGAFRLESPAVILLGIDRFRLAPCRISGNSGEGLDLSADLELDPLSGSLSMGWQGIDPDLFRSYLKGFRPAGRTTGLIKAKILDQGRMDLLARGDFRGSLEIEGRKVDLARSSLNLAWDGLGLRADFDLQTSRQARFWGRAESEEKGHPAFPERGKVSAQWTGLDIDQLLPQRPAALQTRGQLRGRIEGEWSKGPSFNLKGGVSLAGGSLSWKEKGDSLTALVKKGEAGFQGRAEGLKGDLVLEMERHGRINGDFHLPLPARFPLRLKPAGPLEIRLQADLQEKGLMTALWPEAKLSGQGRIKGNVSARGTWERPSFEGDLELTEPGADLAPLGLRVRDITARASFSQDRIIINSLIMHSGPGQLNGRGALRLKDWKIAEIEGRLFGRDFQAVNRTDIQALASPDLTFSGPPGKLSVQGVLEIPQALISGGQPQGFKRASPDLRIIDSPALSLKERVFPIQGEIRLVLGRKVRLKADGLEGLLRGSLGLKIKNSRDISATGEIGIVEGTYLLQGQKLRVTQGRFSFSGPPDNPLIDMIALRSIRRQQRLEEGVDEVQAGIVVTGRIGSPLVKLYSRPPMPEGDILSYILFGEPLKQGTGQQELALLGKAAKTLLGRGMPGELSGLIDLDTLEVRSEGADFSSSVVTVGKYLDPRLYLGLGGSLFSNSYQVILRYSLTPHLEIETKGGTQSGGGIYFKMEFE